jgi:hypothetical protein
MKSILYILIFAFNSIFCFSQKSARYSIQIDTIIERNSPNNLNLEKHQLFIDTTYNSQYHKILNNWNNINSQNIQSWTVIRKLGNDFLIYDRSDGMDPIFQFNKGEFIINGVHEKTKYKIETKKRNSNIIIITIEENNRNFKTIEITNTNNSYVSVIRFYGKGYDRKYWITKFENIKQFDCLVNSYKFGKMSECNKFTEPK